jgi:NAD(P)-dependent dehydrogenase (short-subunit alcohol dehydrogenase family)
MGRVLITGGTSGIGFDTAAKYLADGDHVVVCGSTADKLADAVGKLAELGDVHGEVVDVADQAQVEALVEEHGPFDTVVANAGICWQARLDDENSDEVWARTMDVNVNGVYYTLKAAAKTMDDGGNMIVVSSGLGKNARAAYEAYTASKHAVLGLMKCVALELAPRNIRVNAVCPGWVDTPMSRADAAEAAERAGKEEQAFRNEAISGIPLGRMVDPDDVANLIHWLTSDAASAITGQSYNIACGEFQN